MESKPMSKAMRQAPPPNRIKRYLIVAGGICLAVTVALGYAFYTARKPLKRVYSYTATSVSSGQPAVAAEVFTTGSMDHLLYIKRPDVPGFFYRWFAVDMNEELVFVASNLGPSIFGIEFYNPNQAVGIELTQPKLEDNWNVSFNADTIEFHNSTTKVTVLKTVP